MTKRALRALEALGVYAELGPGRTLAKVSQLYAERGESLPLVTLKRWSSRYHWRAFVKQHEQIVARAFTKRAWTLLHDPAAWETRELELRYLQAVMLGPKDDPH